jgi:hypothetical protein
VPFGERYETLPRLRERLQGEIHHRPSSAPTFFLRE